MSFYTFNQVSGENGWMSNMAPYRVAYQGHVYSNVEIAFQVERCREESEQDKQLKAQLREKIRSEPSPMIAKRVARSFHKEHKCLAVPYLHPDDVALLTRLVLAKFEQNPGLGNRLRSLPEGELIEDATNRWKRWSQKDDSTFFWGACRLADIPKEVVPLLQKKLTERFPGLTLVWGEGAFFGRNEMGKILQYVRGVLVSSARS